MPPPQHFVVDQNWPFGTKISHLGPKKTPGTVKSVKWSFCSFSAPGGHWEKRKQIHIMTLVQLFSIHMTSIHPRHLPDTLRHHPDTARHPQTPSRHPSDTPIFGLHAATGRKSNIWIPWYLFNWSQFIWHLPTPVSGWCLSVSGRCLGCVDVLEIETSWINIMIIRYYSFSQWPHAGQILGCLDGVWGCLRVSGGVWMVSKGVWQMPGGY